MRLPLYKECVTNQEVISQGEFKYSIPFAIMRAITVASMEDLITTRRGTNMTTPITKED